MSSTYRFKLGDKVVHRSDSKSRNMVVAGQCFKKIPPDNDYNALVNVGKAMEGQYHCTWISGTKKGEGLFHDHELDHQPV